MNKTWQNVLAFIAGAGEGYLGAREKRKDREDRLRELLLSVREADRDRELRREGYQTQKEIADLNRAVDIAREYDVAPRDTVREMALPGGPTPEGMPGGAGMRLRPYATQPTAGTPLPEYGGGILDALQSGRLQRRIPWGERPAWEQAGFDSPEAARAYAENQWTHQTNVEQQNALARIAAQNAVQAGGTGMPESQLRLREKQIADEVDTLLRGHPQYGAFYSSDPTLLPTDIRAWEDWQQTRTNMINERLAQWAGVDTPSSEFAPWDMALVQEAANDPDPPSDEEMEAVYGPDFIAAVNQARAARGTPPPFTRAGGVPESFGDAQEIMAAEISAIQDLDAEEAKWQEALVAIRAQGWTPAKHQQETQAQRILAEIRAERLRRKIGVQNPAERLLGMLSDISAAGTP